VRVVVAAILVAVTTLVLGAFGVVDYLGRRSSEMARLRRVGDAQADELAAALALPVWNIDRAQIDKILDSQQDAAPIEAVVVDAAGTRHARMRDAHRRLVTTNGPIRTAGLLAEERPIVFGGERIGTVQLYTTPKIIEGQLRQALLTMIATIIVIDVILVLSIYLVLYRTVLRPLMEIDSYACAVSAGAPGEPLGAAGTDEFDHLRTSIEAMVGAVKAEQDFTDTALDVVNEIFFVQDRHGKFVRWNKAAELVFGLETMRDRKPRYILEHLTHPDDRANVLQCIREILDGRGFAETDARYFSPEGTRDLHLGGKRMEIGGQPYIVGTGLDVTEQRKADAERQRLRDAIRQSAIEWRQTFDSVSTPIVITDGDGVIQRLNRSAAALAGASEEELVGRNVDVIRHDGDGRMWDVSVNPLFPNSPDHSQIVVFWEITRIVALQESLRRSETMTAMGKLVGGVAHEVRNPLFGISATLDAYGEEMSTPDLQAMAATLREQVGRLSRLMKELLEFGRPVAVTRKPGPLDSLISEVLASRRSSAGEVAVEMRNCVGPEVRIPMDRERLRQVFENVVDNALQHSPRGSVVTISGEPLLHAGRDFIEIRVDDEGKGFAPGEPAHVFEPFFTRRERGTGLGLSIVQKIVEEHDGTVSASNRAEGGARITIRLPA
jgi:PAS domain S-box-containing protein